MTWPPAPPHRSPHKISSATWTFGYFKAAAYSGYTFGDFNGDGKADILWRSTAGDVVIWLINGTAIANAGNVANVSSDWTVAGVGDFNGDGIADILWNDSAGDEVIWFMNGIAVTSYRQVGSL
jgi:hypothetical protein